MSDVLVDALRDLLEASIDCWALEVAIDQSSVDDHIHIEADGTARLKIYRAPDNLPFRWVVEINERKRTAASINGVLRVVRQTLAPGYQPYQLTMAPSPGYSA